MFFGIVHPEMVTLCLWIADMRPADLLDLSQDSGAAEDGQPQLLPVPAFAARDNIINGGKAQFLMVKMPVFHGCVHPASNLSIFHPFAGRLSTLESSRQSTRHYFLRRLAQLAQTPGPHVTHVTM